MFGLHARLAPLIAVLLAGALACGCEPVEPTQLVVVVDGDLADRITRVVVRTSSIERAFERPLPFSFGLVPRRGNAPSEQATIDFEGWSGDQLLVTQRVTTAFIANERRLLDVSLDASCLREVKFCGGEKTCRLGECVDPWRDPETLAPVTPRTEIPDAGALDGAVVPDDDGGATDAGSIDASAIDAGSTDGGAIDSGELNNGRDDATMPLPLSCAGLAAGLHTIDADGGGPSPSFEVWCDDGDGGWTVLGVVNGAENGLGYDAAEWTGGVSYARPASELSSRSSALFEAYWRLPVRELRVVMTRMGSATPTPLSVSLDGPVGTLRAAMDGGRNLGGSPSQWLGLIGWTADNNTCVVPPVPATSSGPRVRVGVLFSGPNGNCMEPVGWVGLGAGQPSEVGCDVLASTAGGGGVCGGRGQRFSVVGHAVLMGR